MSTQVNSGAATSASNLETIAKSRFTGHTAVQMFEGIELFPVISAHNELGIKKKKTDNDRYQTMRFVEKKVKKAHLFTPLNIQRDINAAHANKLSDKFNKRLCRPIIVIKVGKNRYIVVDGNHRVQAILSGTDNDYIICLVLDITHLTPDEKREFMNDYIRGADAAKPQSVLYKLKLNYNSGFDTEIAMVDMCRRADVRLVDALNVKSKTVGINSGKITHVNNLYNSWAISPEKTEQGLKMIRRIWPNSPVNGVAMLGFTKLLHRIDMENETSNTKHELDFASLENALRAYASDTNIMHKKFIELGRKLPHHELGMVSGGSHVASACARALLHVYNKTAKTTIPYQIIGN